MAMTFYELKNKVVDVGKEVHFWDAETLKCFGERLSEMRLLKNTAKIVDACGEIHTCYVVSATRRKNAFGRCKPYTARHYFDTTTYEHVKTI